MRANVIDVQTGNSDTGTWTSGSGGGHTGLKFNRNTVMGGGAHWRNPNTERYIIPQRCQQKTERFCQADSDCSFDTHDDDTCDMVITEADDPYPWIAPAPGIERNQFLGGLSPNADPYFAREIISTFNNSYRGSIRHNLVEGADGAAIILLGKDALETTVVKAKVVRDTDHLITLSDLPLCPRSPAGEPCTAPSTEFLGAKLTRNDFYPDPTNLLASGVQVFFAYLLPTELSVGMTGNYWGQAQPPCFRSEDSPDSLLIKDSQASCMPFNED